MTPVEYSDYIPTTITEVAPYEGATKLPGATATQSITYESGGSFITSMKMVPSLGDDNKPKIKALNKVSTGKASNFSTANAGGAKTESKAPDKRDDIFERYKEIND